MRIINIVAALSGLVALLMLSVARHALDLGRYIEWVYIASGVQLACACACLAIAGRTGRLNLIAAALIIGGATIFSGHIYLSAFQLPTVPGLTPVGGVVMMAGWLTLAFTRPSAPA